MASAAPTPSGKPVLKAGDICDLANMVNDRLRPYRIGDEVGYALVKEGEISRAFTKRGFAFDPTPFKQRIGEIESFSPEAVVQTVAHQLACAVVEPKSGKRFALTSVDLEIPSEPLVPAFGRAVDPARSVQNLATDIVEKLGGARRVLGIPLIPAGA